ncbi:hypothetical protein HW115_19130 [Verrucomicrobiaceae bacterium N1E253]|uniref:Uncharacterized protein n=1 Tax=Oceaniferula marina TaxID=2748318 RepID=A0A851GSI2_9BACT|nr:hypothetical protein [Oceaniferula marina]NWK57740.1 hypothetical protein [Oceaniferula marina]
MQQWLTIAEVNARYEDIGLPDDWAVEPNLEVRDRYFQRYSEARKKIFQEHIDTLPKQEQRSIGIGEHPSQSHSRGKEARVIADELEADLIDEGIDFVKKVEVGAYHGDRIIFGYLIKSGVSLSKAETLLPFYYRGFETRCRVLSNNEANKSQHPTASSFWARFFSWFTKSKL